jgi:hypothetical protein
MTKRKAVDRRLIVVSKRRQPTDEGLARLVAAMVLYQLEHVELPKPAKDAHKDSA